ncbi:ATPase, histidine kinase-, DNA gyrase B-, and HSP90-like domain protein [Synechococcus sp. PCC 7335]|uniref:ATP-binding protein n=1 Tax=Synechococcus sp. (strain ATCC 29403 / PCC 7335) TaxID=91464 RepID=UPI00017EE3C1|nr:ATP-binding protein [Synechococcus sp. PCC 7335]EDX87045.1 ATPase, histidine kinase-, DNA gyrase B-, and HSP90-like domain protein [Synechococcus sp. PCC 7335]
MSLPSLLAHTVNLSPSSGAIVDPRGFKAALQSFIQFLITHQVRATLWVKLPKDDAWWQDIWQYAQQAAGCTIYSLGEQTGDPPDSLAASLRPIPIEQTPELRREYLCLAVCDQFVGSLVAARVAPGTASDKRTLRLYSSTSLRTIAALSTNIKAVIEDSSCEQTIAGAAVLSQWERYFPKALWTQGTLPLSDAFLSWQLQRQEDLRSQLNRSRSSHKEAKSNSGARRINADFLGQAREELQSPLTTIKTALTLLGSPTLKLAQRQRYIEMIATQCDRQKNLVNSIIELLQLQMTPSQSPQPIGLSELLPGIVSIYQPIAQERDIMLAYTIPDRLATVLGVEAELKQVVVHLIKNSIKRIAKRGRIWVSAVPDGKNFIVLTVQDSGSHIPKSEIDRLFEPFHPSTHPSTNSDIANLDLMLVEQLVQRMGGQIMVESPPDRDTLFKVALPVQPPSSARIAASKPIAQADRFVRRSLGPARTTNSQSINDQSVNDQSVNDQSVNAQTPAAIS